MNCEQFHQMMDEAVEQRRFPGTALIEHLQSCGQCSCNDRLTEDQLLSAAIASWKQELPQTNLADRILKALQSTPELSAIDLERRVVVPHPRQGAANRRAAKWAITATVTAGLLICAGLVINPAWQSDGPVAQATPSVPPEASSPARLEEIGSLYVDWIQDAQSRVAETVSFVLTVDENEMNGETTPTWLRSWDERLQPLEQQLDETLKQLVEPAETPSARTSILSHPLS